jgi:hypothetical protein
VVDLKGRHRHGSEVREALFQVFARNDPPALHDQTLTSRRGYQDADLKRIIEK